MEKQFFQFGLVDKAEENRNRELVQEYTTFLDDGTAEKIYATKVEELIRDGDTRLIININDLRKKMPDRVKGLLTNFVAEIICLEQATRDIILRADIEYAKNREFNVGFEGSFGDRHVNPRTLKSEFLGNMVCCEGIVTRCALIRPKIVKSVHYCPATGKKTEKRYTDFTSYNALISSNAYPKEDENKNPLETEFGLCVYKDHQTFSIQELPEYAPPGHLPRSVDVISDHDLVDKCKPGDRVRVIGLYRVLPNKQQGTSTGNFRAVLIANNIQLTTKESEQPNFETEDIQNARKMSRHKGIFDLLARSLAPSIFGHEEVKRAILCMLLGGNEKVLENGTRLRGDINILLIGDPSVAKSQLLRYVIHTAPRVIATTGRGSSGVGLTAAVVHDSDSGERRLEAGAMVLADRGVVCIDEFDKMSDIDRTAIHEVMEQGRVTISKAGVHAKLNARCSVMAAANPVYGRYNLYKTPMENIGMQDSLLSRFDLIFVLLDEHDVDRDTTVATNVLKLHRYRTPGEPDGTALPIGSAVECHSTFDVGADEHVTVDVYEKNREWTAVDDSKKILSAQFMRKYLHMAKNIKPTLSEEASNYITEQYSELRSIDLSKTDRERTMPVTARQLETLIRISTAIAKSRLSKVVELSDAKRAFELLHFACFKEKPKERLEAEEEKAARKAANHVGENAGEEGAEGAEESATEEEVSQPPARDASRTRRRARSRQREDTEDPEEGTSSKRVRKESAAISVARYKKFKEYINVAFDQLGRSELVQMTDVRTSIQTQAGRLPFTDAELQAAFEQLDSEGICMVVDDQITLI